MANRICVVGASNTWGSADTDGGGWVDRLKIDLMKGQLGEWQVFNLGIGGATSSMVVDRVEVELRHRKPKVVIFSIGVNDTMRIGGPQADPLVGLEDFKKNLEEMLAIARQHTDKVFFLGFYEMDESKTQPWEPEYWDVKKYFDNKSIKAYEDALRSFCLSEDVEFVEIADIIGSSEIYRDGVHLNTAGHKKVLGKVKKKLQEEGIT